MAKRKYNFKVTNPEALMEHCPDAVTKRVETKYSSNYAIIAKLLDAAALTGSEVPGVTVENDW